MDNLHLNRKMPRQLTVYIFKVQYRQHAVSLVESEKMHRARKRSLEEENGRERESVCGGKGHTFNFSKRTVRRAFSRAVTPISTRNCLSLRALACVGRTI